MLIIGAGGLVAQMIDELSDRFGNKLKLWSESKPKYPFLEQFDQLQSDDEVTRYLKESRHFILGIGNPVNRRALLQRFKSLGGEAASFVSAGVQMSKYTTIGVGITILAGTVVEAGAAIGNGTLINRNALVCHGSRLGEFCEIGPGVILCGDTTVGDNCFLGAGSTVIPGIQIGQKSLVAAGTLVNKHVEDNTLIAGVPGTAKRKMV